MFLLQVAVAGLQEVRVVQFSGLLFLSQVAVVGLQVVQFSGLLFLSQVAVAGLQVVQFSGLLFLSQVAVAGLQAGVQFSGLTALLRDPEQPSPGAPQPDCGTGIHEGGDERVCQHGSVSQSSS